MSADTKGIAAEYPIYRESRTDEKATFFKCVYRIGGACGCEPTCGISFQWGQKFLINAYKPNANMLHDPVFFVPFGKTSELLSENIPSFAKAYSSS